MGLEFNSEIIESSLQATVSDVKGSGLVHSASLASPVDEVTPTRAGIQLPTDFPRVSEAAFQPYSFSFQLPVGFAQGSENTGFHRSKVRSLVLTAFNVLLWRYTQQDAVDLTLTVTPAYGDLTQTLTASMRTLMRADATALEQVNDVADALRLLQTRASEQGEHAGNSDLYQYQLPIAISFVERSLTNSAVIAGAATSLPWVDGLDIHLIVEQDDEALSCSLRYNASLFKATTVERLAQHLQTLVGAIVAQPHTAIAHLPLLTAAEQQQFLVDWNSASIEFPPTLIHQYIEANAVKIPDAIALRFKDQSLTYAELNHRANQLAHYLLQLGVQPGDRIAVCIEPSLDILVSVLGIFKAGATYVPLDPTHPTERLAVIAAETQPKLLFTQAHLALTLASLVDVTVCLDQDWSQMAALPTHNPDVPVALDQIAYLIYTSGTTGKPKGVMATHANLVNYILVAQQQFRFDQTDVMTAVARFTFSITMFELFSPLIAGGTLVVLEREHVLDFQRMVETLQQVTVSHLSPSLLRKLLAYINENQIDPQSFSQLKHISSGGDTVAADLLEAMKVTFPTAEIYVLYGSSEVSCMGCFYAVPRDRTLTKSYVGKPFPNVSVRLYDAHQNLVPIGVVGEVYFGGLGITRGYLNRADLTQEKFVMIDGQRFYRMGDLGRFDAEGNLELLGRADFQIKLRGIRIEPGEIEANLRHAPGVKDGVVVARALGSSDKSLVAYLVPESKTAIDVEAIRAFLQTKLPDYMIPAAFVGLDALPVNMNQKVDRRALPAPTPENLLGFKPFVVPRNQREQELAQLWQAVLGIQSIGIHDNFFELGGHSLLLVQVLSRLQETLNLDISINRLFECPTIATLAAYLDTLSTDASTERVAFTPIPRHPYLPLSSAQSRFWFLAQVEGGTAYNIPLVMHWTGPLDMAVLDRSLTELIHRHEGLRTIFPQVDGTPVQQILPPQALSLSVMDLPARSKSEQWAELHRLAQAEVQKPFNLAQDLLIRGTLWRLGQTEQVLMLTIHHIVADGWSLALIRQELTQLYAAFSKGQSSPLPPLPIQYVDAAHWQDQWVSSDLVRSQLDYWKQQLANVPPLLELPYDHPRPARQTYRGGSEFFTLSPELTQQLKGLSQRAGSTLYMTLLSSFAILLSRHSRHQDLVIGSPIANRKRRELEALQGVFINLLALRIDLSGNPAFLDLLQQVRQVALDAFAHSDIPFDQVVETVQPDRNPSYSPLFQVLFVLQNAPIDPLELPGVNLATLQIESGTAKYDLTLMMEETADGLRGELEYNSDLFERDTIARMVGHFQTLLTGIVAQPQQSICTLPILTVAEQQQILVEWNHTEANYPQDRCMHQLVEQQVEQTPDAIAVVFEDQSLTYRELNNRANYLAHHLQALGVGPETLVGIYVERSLDMIVGVLGILKAGGAYVPLDPAYPKDRLAFMLEDTQAPVLLTQRSLQANLPPHQAQVVYVEEMAQQANEPTPNPSSNVTPHNLAYLIYTSGSTGKPKGVQIEHRSAVNLLNSIRKQPGLTAQDVMLSVTTLSFDIVVSEIFLPLSVGARLVLVSREVAADGRQLLQVLNASGATFLQPTPATWRLLLAAGWQGTPHLNMVSTGEPLPRDLANQLLPRGKSLWNLYGPTETTIWSTGWQVKTEDGPIYIGKPLDNTQLYILDAHLQPVPVGVPGELYIGGDGLARGYLNRPELTAERFISHPLSTDPQTRLYRTGDLVRWLPNGDVECLGRIDHQVKIRGFRMELGEIETALGQHPQVRQCVVVAREDHPGDKRLVAYLIPSGTESVSAQDFRVFLQQTLPAYMIPAAFVQLESWPLTPNGKIDRRSLPMPQASDLAILGNAIAPRTAIEHTLVKIWEDLLNIHPIGIEDNFFDLGGHSLLTVQLSLQIEQHLGVKLPLSSIITAPTVAQLAAMLDPNQASEHHHSVVLLRAGQGKLPVFFIHDGDGETLLYRSLAHQLDSAIPVYGIHPHSGPEAPILHSRIEEAAAYYVQQIRQVQPHGPYFLGGMCLGGVLVLEIAQQLQQQGEAVKMVAMLDAVDVEAAQRTGYITNQRLSRFSSMWDEHAHLSGPQKLVACLHQAQRKVRNVVAYEIRQRTENLRDRLQFSLFQTYLDRGMPLPPFLQQIPVRKVLMWAKQRYVPQGKFEGEILLFRATQKSSVFDGTTIDDTPAMEVFSDPLFGWEKRATEGVQVLDMPGGHSSMLQEPNVQTLADAIQAYLDHVQADEDEELQPTVQQAA